MDRLLIPFAVGAGIVVGWCAITFTVGVVVGLIRSRRSQRRQTPSWAEDLIRDLQQAKHYTIAADSPEGIVVETPQGCFEMPAFWLDTQMTAEENEDDLRDHIDEHAEQMPQQAKDYLIEEIIGHGYPMVMQMQFHEDLENLSPDVFGEEE